MKKINPRKAAVVAAGAVIGGAVAYAADTMIQKHKAIEGESCAELGTLDAEADELADPNAVMVPNPDAAMTGVQF